MYVTCYYDIYNNPEKKANYIAFFKELAESGVPILLFTDPSFVALFDLFPSTVTVIPMDLTSCEMYQIGMKYNGELPSNRNPEKDIKEYFCLINTKVEFLKKAAEMYPDLDTFMWIDFAIMKLVENKEIFLNKVKEIHTRKFTKITIPGCWDIDYLFSCDDIYWRFCATFLVMPRIHLERLYEDCKHILTTFCTNPLYKLTWEANIWYIVEYHYEKDIIDWYFAKHDDGLLLNL